MRLNLRSQRINLIRGVSPKHPSLRLSRKEFAKPRLATAGFFWSSKKFLLDLGFRNLGDGRDRTHLPIEIAASGTTCGNLLRDGQNIRPIPLTNSSPGFTVRARDTCVSLPLLRDCKGGEAVCCSSASFRCTCHTSCLFKAAGLTPVAVSNGSAAQTCSRAELVRVHGRAERSTPCLWARRTPKIPPAGRWTATTIAKR